MKTLSHPRVRRWLFGTLCVAVSVLLTSRGLGDESYVSTHGDPPRYMMNAMFLLDMLRDWPFGSLDEVRNWATLYYARYPALSLGHHPPLASVLAVPFIAVLGPSIAAIRIATIVVAASGVLLLHLLVSDIYDEWAGLVAGLVLSASPSLVYETQAALSEPTAVAFTILAAYMLHRFCATQKRWHLSILGLSAALCVYAKPNAVAVYPALLAYAWARLGWRRLIRRDTVVTAALIGGMAGAFISATIAVSSFNTGRMVAMFHSSSSAEEDAKALTAPRATIPTSDEEPEWSFGGELAQVMAFAPTALTVQLSGGAAAACACGLAMLLLWRRPETWLFCIWILSTLSLVLLLTQRIEMERYAAYWLPPLAACAGSLVTIGRRNRGVSAAVGVACALALGTELAAASAVRLHGLSGYEEAAQYVRLHPRGATVLFSGDFDSGYFVFFTRKHDSDRQSIVLRSDKIFTVSMMQQVSVEELVDRPELIAPMIARLGVGYVVIEDQPSSSRVLEWLREELKSPRYVERLRTRIQTRDLRMQNTDVVVYAVRDVSAPAPDAQLDLRLPLISKRLGVPLADLLAGR